MPTRFVQPASAVFSSRSECPIQSWITLSTPEHSFPDAACPLSRAALDALTCVKRALHEPTSIALSVDAANGLAFPVRGVGTSARVGHHRPRCASVRLGPRVDDAER